MLKEIVISRLLDEHQVPGYANDYLLWHEMLHLRHQVQIVNGRCHYHTPAFRQDEMTFDRKARASYSFASDLLINTIAIALGLGLAPTRLRFAHRPGQVPGKP
jgi:hypothetical protein